MSRRQFQQGPTRADVTQRDGQWYVVERWYETDSSGQGDEMFEREHGPFIYEAAAVLRQSEILQRAK